MSKYRDKYMESFTEGVRQILVDITSGVREMTKMDVILLQVYKKELAKYETEPPHKKIVSIINSILPEVINNSEVK